MTTNCVITQKVEILVTACLWFQMIKNLVSLWPTLSGLKIMAGHRTMPGLDDHFSCQSF